MRSKQSYIECGKLGAKARWSREPTYQERFWRNVKKGANNECWPWTKSRLPFGYGKYKQNGHHTTSHRIAYELTHGEIPKGLHVLHHCDNPPCCNPDHLFLGTHQDNMIDAIKKGRRPAMCFRSKRLTEEDVRQIRKLARRFNQTELGKRFEIGQDQVSKIVSRKSWAWVR